MKRLMCCLSGCCDLAVDCRPDRPGLRWLGG